MAARTWNTSTGEVKAGLETLRSASPSKRQAPGASKKPSQKMWSMAPQK